MRTQRCSRCDSKYKEPLSRVAIPWCVLRDCQNKRKQVLSVSLHDTNAEEVSGTTSDIKLEENETITAESVEQGSTPMRKELP